LSFVSGQSVRRAERAAESKSTSQHEHAAGDPLGAEPLEETALLRLVAAIEKELEAFRQ